MSACALSAAGEVDLYADRHADDLTRRVDEAYTRLLVLEEKYANAMLARWKAEWGEPGCLVAAQDRQVEFRDGLPPRLNSRLLGLFSRGPDGKAIARVTVDDVRAEVERKEKAGGIAPPGP